MIKVSDVAKSGDVSSGKVKKSSSGGDFSAYLRETLSGTSSPVSGLTGITGADAVLAAQLVGEEEEREVRKKLVNRGKKLLDKLEEIRVALLNGYISVDKLIEISRFVKEQKETAEDERINEIISEIELRVEVELAKLTK